MLIPLWRYIYIIFQWLKVNKKSPNSRNQRFSYYFCLMMKASRAESEDGCVTCMTYAARLVKNTLFIGQNSKCGRNRVFSHRVGHLELSPKKELTYFKKSPKTHHFYMHTALYPRKLCCRSVTFWSWSVTYWYGSRTSDPYLWLTDPDPGAPITFGSCESWSWCGAGSGTWVHSHNSSQIKSHKEVSKQ